MSSSEGPRRPPRPRGRRRVSNPSDSCRRRRLSTLPDDRVREHGRRSRAVTCLVRGPRRHLAHHLCAHVLELVFELDLLSDGHAVLGDTRCAKRLVEYDVAAPGAKRHADRVGERINAVQHSVTCVDRESYFFGRHLSIPFCLT